jgi:NhaA family Na+:H+ antiporter
MVGKKKKGVINLLQEFSIPLLAGVVLAVVSANVNYDLYHHIVELEPLGHGFTVFGHHVTLHFLINDIFMLFFFGVAAKEITESVLPGGDLNPPSKAINPLLGTLGGVIGPVGVYFLLTYFFYGSGDVSTFEAVRSGWGIPTATDIALAWLAARMIFGGSHPAVNFLLLLAIADDAIGLGIIAVFYPNPDHPPEPIWLGLVLVGMLAAYLMRKAKFQSWVPYIVVGGTLSWLGLINAALHPALALVPIVPFLPGPATDTGLFAEEDEADLDEAMHDHSPLHNFEHSLKLFVDFGLFFFGFANAGVVFSSISDVTWVVLGSLVIGKTLGIAVFSGIGNALGFKYPEGMGIHHVIVAGMIAAIGLTVALFVAGEAFPGASPHQGPAKMGALLSFGAAVIAFVLARMLKIKRID